MTALRRQVRAGRWMRQAAARGVGQATRAPAAVPGDGAPVVAAGTALPVPGASATPRGPRRAAADQRWRRAWSTRRHVEEARAA